MIRRRREAVKPKPPRSTIDSRPQPRPIRPSVIYFRVDDIEAAFEALSGRGVAFQAPPHMIFRHESGLEEWMAFFEDPDGGLLALMAQVQS